MVHWICFSFVYGFKSRKKWAGSRPVMGQKNPAIPYSDGLQMAVFSVTHYYVTIKRRNVVAPRRSSVFQRVGTVQVYQYEHGIAVCQLSNSAQRFTSLSIQDGSKYFYRKYAKGRGIRIDVREDRDLEDIFTLITIKING
jgi:hypothetical protein